MEAKWAKTINLIREMRKIKSIKRGSTIIFQLKALISASSVRSQFTVQILNNKLCLWLEMMLTMIIKCVQDVDMSGIIIMWGVFWDSTQHGKKNKKG